MIGFSAVHDLPDGKIRFSFYKPYDIDTRSPSILTALLTRLQDFSNNAKNLNGNKLEFLSEESGEPVVRMMSYSVYTVQLMKMSSD